MRDIIHRLLLFLVWGGAVLICLYMFASEADSPDGFIIETLFAALIGFIIIAYVLSISINWIITGDRKNWARKEKE